MPQNLHPAMPVIYLTGHKITTNGALPINLFYMGEKLGLSH
jgi:hypothetical protein